MTKICQQWGIKARKYIYLHQGYNCQLDEFMSWKPDPSAKAIDAFVHDWSNIKCYAFPPFNVIGKVLRKVENDKSEGILGWYLIGRHSIGSQNLRICALTFLPFFSVGMHNQPWLTLGDH